ncbi:glycosyltransferase [Sphingomonas bacterium]|uniref:glycosyltransferase n=1 Tax=Sphingomonas bacterium TaxID=1895847 RepID=UPI0015760AC0|nr:glycosyltransferase [Sphingomonas bacterium]
MPREQAAPLTRVPSIVVISDRIDRRDAQGPGGGADWRDLPASEHPWRGADGPPPEVTGGYLERLPLACIAAGLVEQAEIWHHQHGGDRAPPAAADARLGYRAFRLEDLAPPFDNRDMIGFVRTFGAPHILLVYGLGVSPALLQVCGNSIIVYNSIDAPSLRVPAEVSACFDLVLTGAQWQSDEVLARHPGIATAILPVGPEFAAIDLFRPLATAKDYDLIYVAAAQEYKRHDILFDALDRLPRDVRGLCLFGYGENADRLRGEIAARGLSVDCVGPPGVALEEVNRLMNRARFGLVCGRDDGAPAILTEYMLAGLPVLANAELACGRQYILPETGMLAPPNSFADAIMTMRATADRFTPREIALARWTWPHGIQRFGALIEVIKARKTRGLTSINCRDG